MGVNGRLSNKGLSTLQQWKYSTIHGRQYDAAVIKTGFLELQIFFPSERIRTHPVYSSTTRQRVVSTL